MTPWGVDGPFTASMVAAARALTAHEDLVVMMVALLLRDEGGGAAAGGGGGDAAGEAADVRRRELVTANARGVWARLRGAAAVAGGIDRDDRDLNGYGSGALLPAGIAAPSPAGAWVDDVTGAAGVPALVQAAMDEQRLARMPLAWQPWF
jgi:hypothetical protein